MTSFESLIESYPRDADGTNPLERSYYQALDSVQQPVHDFLATKPGWCVKAAAWGCSAVVKKKKGRRR